MVPEKMQGFVLAVREMNGVPMVRDTELAEALGFERPRAIRQLIERLIGQGVYGGATPCGSVELLSGNEATVYYLDERQALITTSKSETPQANEIMGQVIDVFMAWRSGKLASVPSAELLTKLVDRLSTLEAKIETVRRLNADDLRTNIAFAVQTAQTLNQDMIRSLVEELHDARRYAAPPVTTPAPSVPATPAQDGETLTFDRYGSKLRVVMEGGEPWFYATDVFKMSGCCITYHMPLVAAANKRKLSVPGKVFSPWGISLKGIKGIKKAFRVRSWIEREVLPQLQGKA